MTVWFPSWARLALGPRGRGGPATDRVSMEGELVLCLPAPSLGRVGGEMSKSPGLCPVAL